MTPTGLSAGHRGPFEGHVTVDGARLYLLPEMDRLADAFRLVYYDQRGRGRSSGNVEPGEVGIESEVADLDGLRRRLGSESVAILGHSWGGVLAMEYAARRPDRVSHLILLNTAPASAEDVAVFRQHLLRIRPAGDVEQMQAIASSARYEAGDLEAEAAYYRLHYRVALRAPEQVEQVVGRLRAHFTEDDVLKARAIEQRLYDDTWETAGYDLVPKLRALDMPALVGVVEVGTAVQHDDRRTLADGSADDFVPVALAARIARALPNGGLSVLEECGHFAYLEAPDALHEHVTALLESR
ncbi:MAG: alpha/beta fold hydrolase [Gaiellaceae bacterium]